MLKPSAFLIRAAIILSNILMSLSVQGVMPMVFVIDGLIVVSMIFLICLGEA